MPEPSKFSSGSVGSSIARPNDDYMAVRGYGQKLDQYGSDYTLERRMYGDHSANLGRRDGLTDLDRRYPEHVSGGHQVTPAPFPRPISFVYLLSNPFLFDFNNAFK